jgi:putative Mn2+ efflux pump MntP
VARGGDGRGRRLRLRVAVVFGTFEVVMAIVGLLLVHGLARLLGSVSAYVGGVAL